jgi:hypothetical protein
MSHLPQPTDNGSEQLPICLSKQEGSEDFDEIRIGRFTRISFHRTLRIPEDGNNYPLPAGLGRFPIHRVEDYADRVPPDWLKEGGFFIPLYQKEALFLQFEGPDWHPTVAKVCVGRINAITGKAYTENLSATQQDYVVIPDQKWLDGIASEQGCVRQFVAMPLGQGYTVEAQMTDEEAFGGFQIVGYESKQGKFPIRNPDVDAQIRQKLENDQLLKKNKSVDDNKPDKDIPTTNYQENSGSQHNTASLSASDLADPVINPVKIVGFESTEEKLPIRHQEIDNKIPQKLENDESLEKQNSVNQDKPVPEANDPQSLSGGQDSTRLCATDFNAPDIKPANQDYGASALYASDLGDDVMGIATGGRIRQQIHTDYHGVDVWDENQKRSITIYLVNSLVYKEITGNDLPPSPITIENYQKEKIPWFSHYDEFIIPVNPTNAFKRILSVSSIEKKRGIVEEPKSKFLLQSESLIKIKTQEKNEKIKEFRIMAKMLYDAHEWKRAINAISYVIDLEYPIINSDDYVLRSRCNDSIGNFLDGVIDATIAIESNDNNYNAFISRASCRMMLGDYEGVLEDAKMLLSNPEYVGCGQEFIAQVHEFGNIQPVYDHKIVFIANDLSDFTIPETLVPEMLVPTIEKSPSEIPININKSDQGGISCWLSAVISVFFAVVSVFFAVFSVNFYENSDHKLNEKIYPSAQKNIPDSVSQRKTEILKQPAILSNSPNNNNAKTQNTYYFSDDWYAAKSESWQRAINKYPDSGVNGSKFRNRMFEYDKWAKIYNPELYRNSNKPMIYADAVYEEMINQLDK